VASSRTGAAFHPPAAALVDRLSGSRKAFSMGFPITAGSLGFSRGPLVFAPFAPTSAATVSSLMMGFGWGTAGISLPFVGLSADRIGIEHALTAMAFMPIGGAMLAVPLPQGSLGRISAGASDIGAAESPGTDVAP
jgi:hypothetical protein